MIDIYTGIRRDAPVEPIQYSIAELAGQVNAWCEKHEIAPLHATVGDQVTVRNIRYYQGLGIVDRPLSVNGKGFTEKHRLQLIAIRVLQAKGLPLEKIQQLLYDRTEADLRELEQRGLAALSPSLTSRAEFSRTPDWRLTTLDENALILTRGGRELTAAQRQRILDVLRYSSKHSDEPAPLEDFFRPEID